MRPTAALPALGFAALILLPETAAPDGPPARVARLASQPPVRAALAEGDILKDSFIEEWIRIAEIPAPSGAEDRRAAYIEGRFRALGLAQVGRDEAGNVVGLLQGRHAGGPRSAVIAHLDTVAPATADHTVRRLGGGRIQGPGVRDDSSGLAGVLAALDLAQRHRLRPEADIYIVASVGEEVGLVGAERFVADHEGELGAVIAVDGHLGQVSYAATGIAWLKVRFLGEGAHTLRSYEKANPVLAAARAIERISALDVRRSPPEMESWLNIGMLGGGEVPNAQAREAWFVVDVRSNDPALFEDLLGRVRELASRTAREVGVEVEIETVHHRAGARLKGHEKSILVRSALEVLDHLGWSQVELTPRGAADHNVALVRGIPGIAVGVTTGEGAHTPNEVADLEPFMTGVKQILLLILLPHTEPGSTGSR